MLEYSPNTPQFIRADMIKLRQVIINLLSNALKFTQSGSITVIASNCNYDQCNQVHFEVKDTGLGIAKDELDTLFEAFAQTTTGRSAKEGTGLGLAISSEFIRLMGGKLEVSSEVNKGTKFFFDVDVNILKKDELEEQVVSKQIIGLKPNQQQYRILIVDDNEINRQLLIKTIKTL